MWITPIQLTIPLEEIKKAFWNFNDLLKTPNETSATEDSEHDDDYSFAIVVLLCLTGVIIFVIVVSLHLLHWFREPDSRPTTLHRVIRHPVRDIQLKSVRPPKKRDDNSAFPASVTTSMSALAAAREANRTAFENTNRDGTQDTGATVANRGPTNDIFVSTMAGFIIGCLTTLFVMMGTRIVLYDNVFHRPPRRFRREGREFSRAEQRVRNVLMDTATVLETLFFFILPEYPETIPSWLEAEKIQYVGRVVGLVMIVVLSFLCVYHCVQRVRRIRFRPRREGYYVNRGNEN